MEHVQVNPAGELTAPMGEHKAWGVPNTWNIKTMSWSNLGGRAVARAHGEWQKGQWLKTKSLYLSSGDTADAPFKNSGQEEEPTSLLS